MNWTLNSDFLSQLDKNSSPKNFPSWTKISFPFDCHKRAQKIENYPHSVVWSLFDQTIIGSLWADSLKFKTEIKRPNRKRDYLDDFLSCYYKSSHDTNDNRTDTKRGNFDVIFPKWHNGMNARMKYWWGTHEFMTSPPFPLRPDPRASEWNTLCAIDVLL